MRDKSVLSALGRWIIAVAILATAGIAGLGFFVYSVTRSPTSPMQTNSSAAAASHSTETNPTGTHSTETHLTGIVEALGRIEPKGGVIKVAAPSGGSERLMRLLVKQGDQVKAGQAIAIMDNGPRLQAAALQAQAQAQQAIQNLTQIQAGAKSVDAQNAQAVVDQLQTALHEAQQQYDHWSGLYQQGAISAAELKNRQLKVEAIAQRLKQVQQALSETQKGRPSDVQSAQSQAKVAIATFQKAKADLENAIVRAPIDGQVLVVHANSEETVGKDGILELGDTRQMDAVAEVSETEIAKVRVGQSAIITSRALAEPVNGTVEEIGLAVNPGDDLSSSSTADQDHSAVKVKIQLDSKPDLARLIHSQVNVAIEP